VGEDMLQNSINGIYNMKVFGDLITKISSTNLKWKHIRKIYNPFSYAIIFELINFVPFKEVGILYEVIVLLEQ
jgi:hypothetical protein